MVEVQMLPTQVTPRQLTARVKVDNLHDHFLSFLNYNNKNGFVGEDGESANTRLYTKEEIEKLDMETIGNIMLLLATQEEITKRTFTEQAYKLKEVSRLRRKVLGVCKIKEILARMFGYKDYSTLCYHLKWKNTNLIKNRRCKETINLKLFSSSEY